MGTPGFRPGSHFPILDRSSTRHGDSIMGKMTLGTTRHCHVSRTGGRTHPGYRYRWELMALERCGTLTGHLDEIMGYCRGILTSPSSGISDNASRDAEIGDIRRRCSSWTTKGGNRHDHSFASILTVVHHEVFFPVGPGCHILFFSCIYISSAG